MTDGRRCFLTLSCIDWETTQRLRSVVRNHTFTTFASKLLGKRIGIDFGFHFGVILVPFSPQRELRKTTKNLTIFPSTFF